MTRVTPEFCRRTIAEVEKLQKEFSRTLGTTFAFLGDEIYIKGGVDIPSRRHYGNYPQIEDGVGMVRSFLTKFEKLLANAERGMRNAEFGLIQPQVVQNIRVKPEAITPRIPHSAFRFPHSDVPQSNHGTILTGEMFAPVLSAEIEKLNHAVGSRFRVLAVPNTYFGGDVSVAGLLSGQDYRNVADKIEGDFVIIPKHTIKSDEPILIDGMSFDELKTIFDVLVYDLDVDGLMQFLASA